MTRLFIPGPVDVAQVVAQAQTRPMIGHRGKDFDDLYAGLQPRLRQLFQTQSRVYISTSSGTGLQEAAVRNCASRGVLACVSGAFGTRWAEVAQANGKPTARLEAPWGQAITPEAVLEALAHNDVDALTIVHNESSTGVTNPVGRIAQEVRRAYPDVLLLVDAVSSLGGADLPFDAWGLDVLLTSSQKCLALPPGLSFCAVSDRALERARSVPNRGLYFDFVDLEKFALKNQTPATPAISLMFALDVQLDRILDEGLPARFARHAGMAGRVQAWARERFALFGDPANLSPTLTCVSNTRGVDVGALNAHLRQTHQMQIANGYGKLKGGTFRLAHMGETRPEDVAQLLAALDDYLTAL